MSDFLAGVDPTGTRTFQYGMEDAQAGRKSGLRSAIGTAGGAIGGAAVVPGVIGGLVGGIKGLALGKGGLLGRMGSAGRHAFQGAKAPYASLYRGMRARSALKAHQAGKILNPQQGQNLQKYVRQAVPKGVIPEGQIGADVIQSTLKKMNPEQLGKVQHHLGGELAAGAGSLGLSGALSGASAHLQYGKGADTGTAMRRGQPIKTAGYRAALRKLSLY